MQQGAFFNIVDHAAGRRTDARREVLITIRPRVVVRPLGESCKKTEGGGLGEAHRLFFFMVDVYFRLV